jgi:hypothetical protein
MVSISKWRPVQSYCTVGRKKRDITSLLGQMCPPAASSMSFGKLRPIVPPHAGRVVGACKLPVTAVGRAHLVVVDCAAGLDRGDGAQIGEGTGQQQWRWGRWLRGEGAFGSLGGAAGQCALVAVVLGHVGVKNGAVVPVVGMPEGQDTVGVVTINVWSRAPATPMAHTHTVEAEPFCCRVCTHHVTWTTPSDDNWRRAVDGT